MRNARTDRQHGSLDAAFEEIRQQLWRTLVRHALESKAERAAHLSCHHVLRDVVRPPHQGLRTGLGVRDELGQRLRRDAGWHDQALRVAADRNHRGEFGDGLVR